MFWFVIVGVPLTLIVLVTTFALSARVGLAAVALLVVGWVALSITDSLTRWRPSPFETAVAAYWGKGTAHCHSHGLHYKLCTLRGHYGDRFQVCLRPVAAKLNHVPVRRCGLDASGITYDLPFSH